jgi:hypothetical protein
MDVAAVFSFAGFNDGVSILQMNHDLLPKALQVPCLLEICK